MTLDIATRVYNHSFHIDPVVRTLLDTDFYKLLMLQFIRVMLPQTRATFELINRSKRIRLAEVIDERELREMLDHGALPTLVRVSRACYTRVYARADVNAYKLTCACECVRAVVPV